MKTLLDREDLILNPAELGCVLSLTGLPGGSNKIHDRSPYGDSGTIVGATWVRLPCGLWALSHDGSDDYVDCGTSSRLVPAAAVSFIAWVKPTATKSYPTIVSKGVYGSDGYYLQHGGSDGALVLTLDTGVLRVPATGTLAGLPLNTWTQIAWTFNGSVGIYHVNGSETDRTTKSGTINSNSRHFYLGIYDDLAPTYALPGQIAVVRLYNRAFSALEVQNHFNREKHLFGEW